MSFFEIIQKLNALFVNFPFFGKKDSLRLVKGEILMVELGLGTRTNMGNILLGVDCIAYMRYDP